MRVLGYMTDWCPDCVRSLRVLQQAGVEYSLIDIDETEDAEVAMRNVNGGSGKVPTIVIDTSGGRRVLVEPGDDELMEALHHARTEGEATVK